MIKKMFLLLAVIAMLPAILAGDILTLEKAVEAGLERSLSIEAELLQYRNQGSSQRRSLYSWLPSADLSLNKSRTDGVWNEMSGAASLSWSISSNDSRYYEMARQLIEMSNAKLSLEDMKKNIAWQVLNRYIDVLQADELVVLQNDLLAVEEQKYEIAQTEFKLGSATQQKVDEAELNLLEAEIRLNDLEIGFQEKRRELFYYINLPDGGEELESLEREITYNEQPYQANLQFQITKAGEDVLRLNKCESFLNLLPTLSLGYSYRQSSTQEAFNFDEYEDHSELSLGFSYSLFSVLSRRESWKTNQRQWKYYKKQIIDLETSRRNELESLQSSLRVYLRNYELYQRQSALAEKLLQQAEIEYEQGGLSLLDLNEYQNSFYSAMRQVINGYYQVIRTQESINLHLSEEILGQW